MPLLHLRPLFAQYATLLRPTAIHPVDRSGFSGAEIFHATSPLGTFALRCWQADHPTSSHIRTIHKLLAQAFDRGCTFVPVPVANLHGDTLIEFAGRRWQLEPWMPGAPDLDAKPGPERVEAAFKALAELHRAFAGDRASQPPQPSPALLERIRILEGCLASDMHRVRTAFNNEYLAAWDDRVRRYFKLFERFAPEVDLRLRHAAARDYLLQPVLRDVHREHILFPNSTEKFSSVSGIVDFGAMTIDHPAIDLARLLGSYEIDDQPWRSVLLEFSFAQLTGEERLLVEAFDKSGALLSPFRWLWWLFVERRTFRDPEAVAKRFDVLLQRLTRLVDDASPGGDFMLLA
jgi:Ser/Thr protein kinase RdoA (MazF antagonist)